MTIKKYVLPTLMLFFALPASAQTVPDDVRCVLLANLFAKSATDDRSRQLAGQTMAFYLGRLDGRANTAALTTAMRALLPTIETKTGGPAMNACVARLARADQSAQAAGRAAIPQK